MTPGQKEALATLWPIYGLNTSSGMLNPEQTFQRRAPLHLEIGFGMGESLLNQAVENSHLDYIGIEVHRPGAGHLLMQVHEKTLTNIRVYAEDALDVLHRSVPNQCLSRVQIFFPDPWPKKRHHKRRLINRDFIDLLADKLLKGGLIHVATDWQPYAEQISETFDDLSEFVPVPAPARVATKFELRGQQLGHSITDLAFRLS